MFGERDVPLGINAALGAVVVVVLYGVPSSVTGPEIDARLAVIAVGLAVLAAAVADVAAVTISVGIAFLLFDGFVEGDQGALVWHGRTDLVRLGVLCLGAAVGLVIGAWQQRAAHRTATSSSSSGSKVPSQRTLGESRSEMAARPAEATASGAFGPDRRETPDAQTQTQTPTSTSTSTSTRTRGD